MILVPSVFDVMILLNIWFFTINQTAAMAYISTLHRRSNFPLLYSDSFWSRLEKLDFPKGPLEQITENRRGKQTTGWL